MADDHGIECVCDECQEADEGFPACPESTCPLYGKAVMADHPHLDTPAARRRRDGYCVVAGCDYSAADSSFYCTLHSIKWGRGAEPGHRNEGYSSNGHNGHYVARCTCGWRTTPRTTYERAQAALAAHFLDQPR